MLNLKKEIICQRTDCPRPATRALTYFVDKPGIASLVPKQQMFCDEHAEDEMLSLQQPGLFTITEADGTVTVCTVSDLTNVPMFNLIDCQLDVLASNPYEMDLIAEMLNKPSQELAIWIAEWFKQPVDHVADGLKRLLEFKAVKSLGSDNTVNKARRFGIAIKDEDIGCVRSHLLEVSRAFPAAVFLLEYGDEKPNRASKRVMRAGKVVREVFDGDKQVGPWALLDIFAPFRAEYYGETAEFGSLWQPWLEAVMAAARRLKGDQTPASQQPTEATGQHA